MKCAEVMEWMHRYLDKDLSQDEIIEMFRHIDNCPSCAEVFERLTLLSNELEQLPDVKPRLVWLTLFYLSLQNWIEAVVNKVL